MVTVNQEFWRRAFGLAHYIHCDERVAFYLLIHAAELMSLKTRQQDERKGTNLMKLSDPQLFQISLLEASEFYEMRQEREQFGTGMSGEMRQSLLELLVDPAFSAKGETPQQRRAPLNEEDLVVRYIKHLVLVTASRNAYQVMVGISLFLFRHGPKQMARIHEHIDHKRIRGGENGRVYKDARERIRKAVLERFENLLEMRDKRRFNVQGRTMPLIALVNDSLNHLALWDTEHNQFTDEPHQAHALIHPACYEKIVNQLGIKDPTDNLTVPQFALNSNKHQPPRADRRRPPDLTDEQIRLLQQICDRLGRRRKESEPVLLSVRVDDAERARFDPLTGETASFRLKTGARMIEVYSRETDGDLLLAACWLAELDGGTGERATLQSRAEGGQAIRFDITFAEDGAATVEISYRETKPWRWLKLEWRRLVNGFALPKPATAWAIGGLALIGLLLFFWWRRPAQELPRVVKQPTPLVEPSPVSTPAELPSPESPRLKRRAPSPGLARRSSAPAQSPPETSVEGFDAELRERNRARKLIGVQLRAVSRIHVLPFGDDVFSRELREALIARLRQSSFAVEERISPTTDAVLQQKVESDKRFIRLRLVNRAGEVLWQDQFQLDRNQERLSAERIGEAAINALIEAAKKEK